MEMEHVSVAHGAQVWADRLMEAKRDNLPDYGDAEIVVKKEATQSGQAGVMITFTINCEGKRKRVQTVITERNFKMAASLVNTIIGTN